MSNKGNQANSGFYRLTYPSSFMNLSERTQQHLEPYPIKVLLILENFTNDNYGIFLYIESIRTMA
jgi:hypothetical protein